LTELNIYRRKS